MKKQELYALDLPAVEALLVGWRFPRELARPLWRALYQRAAADLAALPDLPPALIARLVAETQLTLPRRLASQESADGETLKELLEFEDGAQVEVVLLKYGRRWSSCISTQVGCACGCAFCATGQQGFLRQLTTAEILAQVLHARRALLARGEELTNVVLMGMGEPLLNVEQLFPALRRLVTRRAVSLSPRRVTLSTVGIVPGIETFREAALPVNLAVSLHAATDLLRDRLVPVNRRYPLAELLRALRRYTRATGRRVMFEWALIGGVNDTLEQAAALVELLGGLPAHVNLIHLNPTPAFEAPPSSKAALETFTALLDEAGITHTVRQRRGSKIAAGCGQLRADRVDGFEPGTGQRSNAAES
jgi:23S rRNA (adenine2503-C2)-methyltransferase